MLLEIDCCVWPSLDVMQKKNLRFETIQYGKKYKLKIDEIKTNRRKKEDGIRQIHRFLDVYILKINIG